MCILFFYMFAKVETLLMIKQIVNKSICFCKSHLETTHHFLKYTLTRVSQQIVAEFVVKSRIYSSHLIWKKFVMLWYIFAKYLSQKQLSLAHVICMQDSLSRFCLCLLDSRRSPAYNYTILHCASVSYIKNRSQKD